MANAFSQWKSCNLELEHQMLASSGLFDESAYLEQAGSAALSNPIDHYLRIGWRLGLEPNSTFPGSLMLPYFATLGYDEPPAITWLTLRSADWSMPSSREELAAAGAGLDSTGLFDKDFYLSQAGIAADGLDLATHYAIVGERMGFAPSEHFDPGYYAACYPDVLQAGFSCLQHYIMHGRAEGRSARAPQVLRPRRASSDPQKDNVLLVMHEASRTGAPILGWNIASHLARKYNLYTAIIGEGDLAVDFENLSVEVYGPFPHLNRISIDLDYSLRDLIGTREFRYAIVNSAESRHAVEPIVRKHVPTLLLMHEFGSYVNPARTLWSALDWSTEIVFPARVVRESALQAHPILAARQTHILPQGESVVPKGHSSRNEKPPPALEKLASIREKENAFIVLGAGGIQIRKGVDMFLAAASKVIRSRPGRKIHFLWVGHGFKPKEDMAYSVYLYEQLNRSGLNDHVTFLDEVSNLEPVYEIADAFLLPSRLDPLPNVSIDATVRGIPLICFREATGIADFMLSHPETARGVVDYHDAESLADVILKLAEDESLRQRMAEATRQVARTRFDMERYVAKLDELGTAAAERMQQRIADAKILLADPTFDQDMFLGPSSIVESREGTISRYLALGAARGWGDPPVADTALRRPCPGFNPRIYAAAHAGKLRSGVDPLADFLREGKPSGSWQSSVLQPSVSTAQAYPQNLLRVVLHAHFFYPELATDFLAHLQPNRARCDLLVSTDNQTKGEELRRVLAAYAGGTVTVRVFPNKGRDLGPLITGFAEDLARYDLIGHVHAKRSLFSPDRRLGESWREFLWQNLLGGQYPMMDHVVTAFERQDSLGLVFPSDPHLVGWDDNRPQAEAIAVRMGWTEPLPDAFDFPLGTMFWMRKAAMQPLFDLRLAWTDYPAEPLPYDGTTLHALERLIPFASQLAGFTQAVTHITGISW